METSSCPFIIIFWLPVKMFTLFTFNICPVKNKEIDYKYSFVEYHITYLLAFWLMKQYKEVVNLHYVFSSSIAIFLYVIWRKGKGKAKGSNCQLTLKKFIIEISLIWVNIKGSLLCPTSVTGLRLLWA